MDIDIWLVVLLCFGFTAASTFAATGAVATAAFVWLEYQLGKVESRYKEVKHECDQLKKENADLAIQYRALASMIQGGAPLKVAVTAGGDVEIGEFAGRDSTR